MKTLRASIDLFTLTERTVERVSASGVPTAFRIWRAGSNPTDKGLTIFSPRSAELLMAAQTARVNLISIDVDHLSLSPSAPPEARKAVGWHRLAVRPDENGEPELWAVDVEWTDVARTALRKDPPEYRYFSPAYDVDESTREVVGYLNTALTNNPATWMVSALASRAATEKHMEKLEDVLAALKAIADEGDEDEKKQAARMIRAAEGEEKEPDGDEGEDEKKDDEKEEKNEEDDESEEDKPEKKEKDSVRASNADPVIALAADVQSLRAAMEALATREERARLLASRSDLAPSVRKWLERAPLSTVRDALKALPVAAKKNPAASVMVAATRGAGQIDGPSSRLPPEQKRELDARMGRAPERDAIRTQGNSMMFGVMTREAAHLARTQKDGGAR